MELNYKTIYFFVMSLSATILILTLTNVITQLNFTATVVSTILIIISGLIAWIVDIYFDHKMEEEEANQYWNVWFYPPFNELKDKKRYNLIGLIILVVLIILFSWGLTP